MTEPSEDVPFVLHKGEDMNIALRNRVAFLNRLNYIVRQKLPNFDIRDKSQDYLNFLDLTLYKQYYKEEGDKPISEEFCQRMAKLCMDLDSEPPLVDEVEFKENIAQAIKPINKESWISRFFKK